MMIEGDGYRSQSGLDGCCFLVEMYPDTGGGHDVCGLRTVDVGHRDGLSVFIQQVVELHHWQEVFDLNMKMMIGTVLFRK